MSEFARLVVADQHRLDSEVLAAALTPVAPAVVVQSADLHAADLDADVLLLVDACCGNDTWIAAVDGRAGAVGLLHTAGAGDLRRRSTHPLVVVTLSREASLEALIGQVERALGGQRMKHNGDQRSPARRIPELSPRERDVLALMARGMGNRDIAEELAISPHTVRTHVQAVLTKFQASNRVAVVGAAHRAGILTR